MYFDFDKIRAEMLQGPRLTVLRECFERIASREEMAPVRTVEPSPSFLRTRDEYAPYYAVYERNLGAFNRHAIASVPFALEQCVRMGVALARFARVRSAAGRSPTVFYGTSSADGTHARALAEYSGGGVVTLTDSPSIASGTEFFRLLTHDYSFFHLGPFVDITPQYLQSATCSAVRQGFDVVWENTTFQMYGRNRLAQIAYVKRVLRKDGLMIFIEKLSHEDRATYDRMERIKDELFKARYFSRSAIDEKKEKILSCVESLQVTLGELRTAIRSHFRWAHVVWNSANFVEIVASNSLASLECFLAGLPEPYVPEPFATPPIVVPLF